MDEAALSYSLLAQRYYIEVMILAHGLSEVELAFDLFWLHHLMVIFVSDALIILHHVVALVLLCIGTHITSILCLDACEV